MIKRIIKYILQFIFLIVFIPFALTSWFAQLIDVWDMNVSFFSGIISFISWFIDLFR